MENDDNLDLLDLDDDASLDTLPDATPFAAPRPKKPWLLLGVTLLVIILATFVIIRVIGSDSSSSIEIDLDAPEIVTVDTVPVPAPTQVAAPVVPAVPAPAPAPKPAPVDVEPSDAPVRAATQPTPGVPVRVVPERRNVTFDPNKPERASTQPTPAKPAKVAKPAPKKPAPKPQVAPKNAWYVQFGSYSTRAAAENAERKIRAGHAGLFQGQQFVILAAVLPNGNTTYRLRIAFADNNAANGFCRNAKSDGLDCYVAK